MSAKQQSRRSVRGFTMIELMVVIGMLGAAAAFLPAIGRSREAADRIKCSSNLRMIALAFKMYANGETRTMSFPRTRYDKKRTDSPTAFTQPDAPNPFKPNGPEVNDVTAALWLAIRTQEMTTDVLVCPSVDWYEPFKEPEGTTYQFFSNFPSPKNLSYSMNNPYAAEAGIKSGFAWNDAMNADFAILADINPGGDDITKVKFADAGAEQRKVNSRNHQRDGQNVCYADGHVDWSVSAWAGAQQDHIYGFRKDASRKPTDVPDGIAGPPADAIDSVMLPTDASPADATTAKP